MYSLKPWLNERACTRDLSVCYSCIVCVLCMNVTVGNNMKIEWGFFGITFGHAHAATCTFTHLFLKSSNFCSPPPHSEAKFFLNRYTSLKISMEQMLYAIFLDWPTNKTVHLGVPKTAEWTTVYLVGREDLGPVNFTTLHPQGVVLEVPQIPTQELPCQWAWTFVFQGVLQWLISQWKCLLQSSLLSLDWWVYSYNRSSKNLWSEDICDILCAITLFVACMGKFITTIKCLL